MGAVGAPHFWRFWRTGWRLQRGLTLAVASLLAANGFAPIQLTLSATKEHVAIICRTLALRRGGGRRGSGIGDARENNQQSRGSDQGGNNAFHGDSPQLSENFAITARSMAGEYRRSINAETAKSRRYSVLKCNNRIGKRWRNRAAPRQAALRRERSELLLQFSQKLISSAAVCHKCGGAPT